MNPLLESILKAYFGSNKHYIVDQISAGLTNYNYKIVVQNQNHAEYFLKIFRYTPVERVAGITQLMTSIIQYHFPTPELIKCRNGDLFWGDGNQSAIITRYINGGYPEKNPLNLFKIGIILGMLHGLPVTHGLLRGYSLEYYNQIAMIEKSGIALTRDLVSFLDLSRPIIEKIPKSGFPESIIHGDVFLDNLLTNDLGDIFFIDFEGGCIDRSIFDLSRSVIGCAIRNEQIDMTLAQALIQGYNMSRKLHPIELDYLFDYIIYAGTVSTLWRFIEFNIKRPGENKTDLFLELLKPTNDLLNLGKEIFIRKMYTDIS